MTIILYIILHKFAIFYITGKMQKEMEEFCMDIRLLEEATGTLRRTANQGVDRRQKDAYFEMARRMNVILQSMQMQQQKLRQLSNLASEAHNSNLEDTFQQIARRMSHEIQEAEAVMCQMRNIANSN